MAQANQLTLLELAKRTNNKEFLLIAEILNQVNHILEDAPWVEANQQLNHVGVIRTSLPRGTWRRFNTGITRAASTTQQIVETMGMLEDYSVVDKALADISGNPTKFRTDEDLAFIEGMSQTLVGAMIYGDLSANLDSFRGITQRYNRLTTPGVWNAGGTGADTTSVWIVDWDTRKVHMIYPKGASFAGIKKEDLGQRPAHDSDGNPYEAWWTHFKVAAGLFVRDARSVQRICNIRTSGTTNLFNEDLAIMALNSLPVPGGGNNCKMYVNRTVKSQIEIIARSKQNVFYPVKDAFGKEVVSFRGIPIRMCEQILNTETAVV